jgi:hypothetical protein
MVVTKTQSKIVDVSVCNDVKTTMIIKHEAQSHRSSQSFTTTFRLTPLCMSFVALPLLLLFRFLSDHRVALCVNEAFVVALLLQFVLGQKKLHVFL